MVWYKPSTWGKKDDTTSQPQQTSSNFNAKKFLESGGSTSQGQVQLTPTTAVTSTGAVSTRPTTTTTTTTSRSSRRSGGGSGGSVGITPSGLTSEKPTTAQDVLSPSKAQTIQPTTEEARRRIEVGEAEDVLIRKQQSEIAPKVFGYGLSTSNPLSRKVSEKVETNTQYSTKKVPPKQIMKLQSRGEITPDEAVQLTGYYGRDVYTEAYERESSQAINAFRTKEKANLDKKFKSYQSAIDEGEDFDKINLQYEKDVAESNKRLRDYSLDYTAKWEKSRGQYINKSASKLLFSSNIYYADVKSKQNLFKPFVTGFGVGAGVSTIGLTVSKVSKTAGKAFGKFGTGVGVAVTAYEYIKGGVTAFKTYKSGKKLGFTTTESLTQGTATFGTSLTPFASGSLGALAGGLTVVGGYNYLRTGSVKGFTATDQKNLKRIITRKNAIKTTSSKGGVKDITVKEFGTGKTIKGGTSIRKLNVKINTEGLTSSEIATAKKLNLRGFTYQNVDVVGKNFKGFEVTNLKVGGLFGQKVGGVSTFKGIIKGDTFGGIRTSIIKQGKVGKFGIDAFVGKGSTKYFNEGLFRGDKSTGVSLRLFETGFTNGQVLYATNKPTITTGKQGTFSILTGAEIVGTSEGLGIGRIYSDLAGTGQGGKFLGSNIKVTPAPSKSFSTGGGTVQLTTTSKPIISPPSTSSLASSLNVKIVTAPISTFYGTGQYERTMGGLEVGGRVRPTEIRTSSPSLTPQPTTVTTLEPMQSPEFDRPSIFVELSSMIPTVNPSGRTSSGMGLGVATAQRLKLNQQQITRQTSRPSYASPITPTTFTPPPFKPTGFGWFNLPSPVNSKISLGDVKARRTYQYFPSFKALTFGIKGKGKAPSPKTKFTGLEVRPIFSNNLFGKKKKRRITFGRF